MSTRESAGRPPPHRAEELRSSLDAVRARVHAACAAAGRDVAGTTLVVITKTYPADDVRLLAGLGVTDVGEARDQEASAKADQVGSSGAGGLRWHMVGRLQRNKARAVVSWADVVHSVDRVALVAPLAAGARAQGRTLGCFVQVSLDGDPSRGGAEPGRLAPLADAVVDAGLRLLGVMAIAPQGVDPDVAFDALSRHGVALVGVHPSASAISAGMSGDLEAAIRHGATHLRVGTAVLGARQVSR